MQLFRALRANVRARAPVWTRLGCTKTRNWEIRNGKWGNAEMRKCGNGERRTKAWASSTTTAKIFVTIWPAGGAP